MLVKDLIIKLQKYNPELHVAIKTFDHEGENECLVNIADIGLGSPYGEDGLSVVDNSEMPDELWDDEDECYSGPGILIMEVENLYR